jgi:hypothetical protein
MGSGSCKRPADSVRFPTYCSSWLLNGEPGAVAAPLEHDPEKWNTGFPSGQTRSVCPEIMLQQKDAALQN